MKMTLMGHFRELKSRLVWSLLFFAAAFAAGLWLSEFLQSIVLAPLQDASESLAMIYTGIADGLTIEFSLAGLFALLVSVPFILWQLWKYIAPALKKNEKKIAVPLIIASPILFLAGALFAYFVLFPIMFRFFISIGGTDVALMPNMKNYLSFSVDMLKAFGLAFQFPLVLIMLNRAGIVSRKQILSASRYAIVGIFIIAAVLTPPDIVSQVALAAPLLLLFTASLVFIKR